MNTRISIDSEALLAQVGWVRALARRLVGDAAEAEDVAQEAFVVALRGTRQEPRALRHWLGGVVRNLSRTARRDKGRRGRMEAPMREDLELPSTLELMERAATQRALVGMLLEQKEPERSVLLLRYFQELSNEEIAEHLGIPASTVATRLARAHGKMRAAWLARTGEDPRKGLAALAAFAQAPVGWPTPAPLALGEWGRGLAMGWKVAAVLGLMVGGGWCLRTATARVAPDPGTTPLVQAALATLQQGAVEPSGAVQVASFLRQGREPSQGQAPFAPANKAHCPAPRARAVLTRGRALDMEGRPVAELEVCRFQPYVTLPGERAWRGEPGQERAISDQEGRFEMSVPALGWFAAVTQGWTTVLGGELGIEGESVLVVSRSRPLHGDVVDANGVPLSGVSLAIEVAPERMRALGQIVEGTFPLQRPAKSDVDGGFAFPDAPEGALVVHAQASGYQPLVVDLAAEAERHALRLVLMPSRMPILSGTIVDASGQPVEGASVSTGHEIVTSDAQGAFRLAFDTDHPPHHWPDEPLPTPGHMWLTAIHPTLGMAREEVPSPLPGSIPDPVHLSLAGEALTLEGRVVDMKGEPVPWISVFVCEETILGWTPIDGLGRATPLSLESMMGAHPTRTSEDGSFRITGLVARDYRVEAMDSTHLLAVISEPLPAGSRDVLLRLDTTARGPLGGRIVDRTGAPIEGVRVSVSRREGYGGPDDRGFSLAIGASTQTDGDGKFLLSDVARDGVFLRLEGELIVPEIFRTIDPEADPTALRLVVARRCHLQVDWGDWNGKADRLLLEDAAGSPLGLMDLNGRSVTPREWVTVGEGLSRTYAIPETATQAVLSMEGLEVMRVPLHPRPGELEFLQL